MTHTADHDEIVNHQPWPNTEYRDYLNPAGHEARLPELPEQCDEPVYEYADGTREGG